MEGKKWACSHCGLPRGIGKGNVWHKNGVITASQPPHIRGTLYDVEELNNLFPAISRRIGFDITRLVIEGKRRDGVRYTRSLMENLRRAGMEPAAMDIFRMISRFCAYWGLGIAEILEYREGEALSIRTPDYYSDPMARGDWAGVFEAAAGRRGDPRWRDESTREIIDVLAVEGEPELEERIEQEVELGIPFVEEGDLEYRHCPECGIPLAVSEQFEWNPEISLIRERISGRRFILHNTNGIVAVVRVLEEELGEEIGQIIAEISRDYARQYYGEIRDRTSLEAELLKFPLRSWGRATTLKREGNVIHIRIFNPYSGPIVSGRVWGLLETFENRDLVLEGREEGEGYVDILLKRA
ncbi:hypothetical protein [Candidatus Solincola sp.]|nr:hypothetical protein [Actinomycetota bacterium]MDI7253193.1 hypothetical protein [Actinomycetota bacterium]